MVKRYLKMFGTVLGVFALAASVAHAADEIVIYSARNEQLIKPLFDAYTAETGTKIRFITDKEGPLLERLKAEGAKHAGGYAHHRGRRQPLACRERGRAREAGFRHAQGECPGAPARPGRPVGRPVHPRAHHRVQPEAGEPFGTLDLRRPCRPEMERAVVPAHLEESLQPVAHRHDDCAPRRGADREDCARLGGQPPPPTPFPDDTKEMEAIAAGQCDVGIVNTYYYGRLMKKKPELPLALFWPNQKDRGVHVNVSGAGVTNMPSTVPRR